MALPKKLDKIDERLARIEAALGIDQADGEASAAPPIEPPAETPEQVAERIDYNAYSASEIIERVDSLTSWERQMLVEYEKAHDNRKTVLAALS